MLITDKIETEVIALSKTKQLLRYQSSKDEYFRKEQEFKQHTYSHFLPKGVYTFFFFQIPNIVYIQLIHWLATSKNLKKINRIESTFKIFLIIIKLDVSTKNIVKKNKAT